MSLIVSLSESCSFIIGNEPTLVVALGPAENCPKGTTGIIFEPKAGPIGGDITVLVSAKVLLKPPILVSPFGLKGGRYTVWFQLSLEPKYSCAFGDSGIESGCKFADF